MNRAQRVGRGVAHREGRAVLSRRDVVAAPGRCGVGSGIPWRELAGFADDYLWSDRREGKQG